MSVLRSCFVPIPWNGTRGETRIGTHLICSVNNNIVIVAEAAVPASTGERKIDQCQRIGTEPQEVSSQRRRREVPAMRQSRCVSSRRHNGNRWGVRRAFSFISPKPRSYHFVISCFLLSSVVSCCTPRDNCGGLSLVTSRDMSRVVEVQMKYSFSRELRRIPDKL